MAKNKQTNAKVSKAKKEDLHCILAWLKCEYDEDGGSGFWCNRGVIEKSFREDHDLWVIRQDGKAVAFQVGKYAAVILAVRKDHRKQGMAASLIEASVRRARADNVTALSVQCAPEESLEFWKHMGFKEYSDPRRPGLLLARRTLPQTFELPLSAPKIKVVIGFYPEATNYGGGSEITPIIEHFVMGVQDLDGSIMLERRVVGICSDEPDGKDLIVRIVVNNTHCCFCKAKHQEAKDFGLEHDPIGSTFL